MIMSVRVRSRRCGPLMGRTAAAGCGKRLAAFLVMGVVMPVMFMWVGG